MTRKQDTMNTRDWLKSGLSQHRRHVIAAVVLGFAALSCAVLLMFTAGYLICRTAQPGVTLFMVMVPVALVQLFGLGRPIMRYFERLVSHDWVFRITSSLRLALFRGIAAKSREPNGGYAIGRYLDMLADDVGHLQNLYLRSAFPIVMALLLGAGFVVLCACFSPTLALVALALLLVCAAALPYAALAWSRASSRVLKSEKTTAYERLTDDIMGATDWSLSGRSAQAAESHAQALETIRSSECALRRRTRIVELASAIVLAAGACAIVALCGQEFGAQAQTANWTAAFALGFFPIMEAVVVLPFAFAATTNHVDALERLHEIVPHEKGATQTQPAFNGNTGAASAQEESHLAKACSPHLNEPSVELEAVSYRYPDAEHDALHNVSLAVTAGQKLAVIGRSGSGKSTLASVIRGALSPHEGTVRVCSIDACGRGKSQAELSQLVSFIPQRPYLFDRSLRDNIALANPDATDEQILEALERVGLASRVAPLKRGLATRIGETGFGFSGGESHRIALARALVADTPIVMLDEPFAALDTETERALLATLFDAFEGKTLLVITHHLLGIERFDRVLLIEDGRIDLDGTPLELAEHEPRFRNLLAFDRTS